MIKLIFTAVTICIFFTSCTKLEQSYPARHFYIIDVNRNEKPSEFTIDRTLEINRFDISPNFSGREFIYRTSENEYSSDFYNQFFKTPVSLITTECYEWFTVSGLFTNVINRSIPVEPDLLISANVTKLYADLRNPDKPISIISIQFFITDESSADSNLVFNKNFNEEVEIESRSPEKIVDGWNKALEMILIKLENDLKALEL